MGTPGASVGQRSLQMQRLQQPPGRKCRGMPRCRAAALAADFTVREASSSAELRSVAALRAANFFDYERAACSDFAARSAVRVKADAIWEYLEESYADPESQGMLTCLFAAAPADSPVGREMRDQMDRSCMLPAEQGSAQVVLGSLDLTVGLRLAGESLAGRLPAGPEAAQRRAYVSNVSVAPAARRMGVASELMAAACAVAAARDVTHLYVHAAVDNAAACALYSGRCGFRLEAEEGAATARALQRPKRLLFHRELPPPPGGWR